MPGRDAAEQPTFGITSAATSIEAESHAEGTDERTPVVCLVDWLRVTFPATEGADNLERALWLFDPANLGWTEQDHGRWFYKRSYKRGSIEVHCDGNGGAVTVDVSGQGCRQWEAECMGADATTGPQGAALWFKGTDTLERWRGLLSWLLREGCKFTRLDVAWDDQGGWLNLDVIDNYMRGGLFCTRFQKVKPHEHFVSHGDSTGQRVLEGWSFGTRQSLMFVRIYNKRLEQIEQKGVDETTLPAHWLRVEAAYMREKAHAVAELFARVGPNPLAADLAAMLDYKERNPGDHQRDRWPTAEWWKQFLGLVERARVTLAPQVRTVEAAATALQKQFGAVLAMLLHLPGYGVEWMKQQLAIGEQRWSARHVDMMARYLRATHPDAHIPEPTPQRAETCCQDCGKVMRGRYQQSPLRGSCWGCYAVAVYGPESVPAV